MMSMIWDVSERGWRKGPWTPEEDKILIEYVTQYGEGRWSCVSKLTGLKRSGKSCRLRWVNYLRPGLKKGNITPQEEGIIIELHALWGNKWSTIARYLPGRTDNEIKNYWRTHFKKRSKSSPAKQHAVVHHNQKQNQEDGGNGKFSNSEDGGVSSDRASSCDDRHRDSSSKQEMGPNDSTGYNNRHQFVPMFYYSNQDVYGGGYNDSLSSDFIMVDSNLWGGLWN